MTERVTPVGPLIQANNENAEPVREMIMSLLRCAGLGEGALQGIVAAGDLAVSQHAGTPGMNVDVAAGRAFVQGGQTSFQGSYHVSNDATKTLTIAASNPSNPRIDIVVATVRDHQYPVYTQNDWLLQVITGTASGSPVAPATPTDSIVLAQVAVAANVTSIVNANITDKRARAGTTRYHASAHASGTQNGTGGAVVTLQLDTEDYDPGNNYNNGTYTYTCPASGIYLVTASMLANATAGGDNLCAVSKNGTQYRELGRDDASNGFVRPTGSTTILCAAGDTLQIVFLTTGSVAGAISSGWADFIFLGPS